MFRSAASAPLGFDVVVPVPTTPERLRARGFNPARELARAWGGRVRARGARRRPGPAQVGRSRRERRSNLRGVFVAEPRWVAGRRVLVVDDVITTGATASAMVDELRLHGAAAVGVIALASASV
jgi:predicted amidophosphoribosyltransferase